MKLIVGVGVPYFDFCYVFFMQMVHGQFIESVPSGQEYFLLWNFHKFTVNATDDSEKSFIMREVSVSRRLMDMIIPVYLTAYEFKTSEKKDMHCALKEIKKQCEH